MSTGRPSLFSIGHPYDRDSELFQCDYDFESDPAEGVHVAEVRLDETMQEPGDVLDYLDDYGEDWHLTLKLEKVLDAAPDAPPVVCVAGRCAAPPEDGFFGEDDPDGLRFDWARFDLSEVNRGIREYLS